MSTTRPATRKGGRPDWTKAELRLLHKHYPVTGSKILAGLIDRKVRGIIDKANELGIKCGQMGRPRTKPAPKPAATLPAPTQHDPRPKSPNTLRPLQVRVKPEAPAPTKRSPATPNLNALVAARRYEAREQAEKPKPYVTAEQLRKLPGGHPARLAYTAAANKGPAAATKAFYAALQQAT